MIQTRERLQKANDDYKKRISGDERAQVIAGFDRAQVTFVFATPRIWAGKDAWIATHKAESVWKDVVAIDAVNIVV